MFYQPAITAIFWWPVQDMRLPYRVQPYITQGSILTTFKEMKVDGIFCEILFLLVSEACLAGGGGDKQMMVGYQTDLAYCGRKTNVSGLFRHFSGTEFGDNDIKSAEAGYCTGLRV